MTTLEEALANHGVPPNGVYDLKGQENLSGSTLRNLKDCVIKNANFVGMMELRDCENVRVEDCVGRGDEAKPLDWYNKAVFCTRGNRDISFVRCHALGGWLGGSFNIGTDGTKTSVGWTLQECVTMGNKLWRSDQFPRAHSVYAIGNPKVNSHGLIKDCRFTQNAIGQVVKLGGTSMNPTSEGMSGVNITGTSIVCDGAALEAPYVDRATAILVNGPYSRGNTCDNTEIVFTDPSIKRSVAIQLSQGGRMAFGEGMSIRYAGEYPLQQVEDYWFHIFNIWFAWRNRGTMPVGSNVGGVLSWKPFSMEKI